MVQSSWSLKRRAIYRFLVSGSSSFKKSVATKRNDKLSSIKTLENINKIMFNNLLYIYEDNIQTPRYEILY